MPGGTTLPGDTISQLSVDIQQAILPVIKMILINNGVLPLFPGSLRGSFVTGNRSFDKTATPGNSWYQPAHANTLSRAQCSAACISFVP